MRLRKLLLLFSITVDLILLHNPHSTHGASTKPVRVAVRGPLKVDLEVQAQTPGVAGFR